MILAGNWKMNQTPKSAQEFMEVLQDYVSKESSLRGNIILLIPSVYFYMAQRIFKGGFVKWGGQNCFSKSFGSFTGETSPQVLREMGAEYCLVGHSERRKLFSENLLMVEEKFHAVIQHQMKPILCVGEALEQKSQMRSVLESQLKSFKKESNFIVAYEPVWAIGSGASANIQQIENAVRMIQGILEHKDIPILYGGSVQYEYIKEFSKISGLNGVLVGKNSLSVSSFIKLYEGSKKIWTK